MGWGAVSFIDAYNAASADLALGRARRGSTLDVAQAQTAADRLQSLNRPSPTQLSDAAFLRMEAAQFMRGSPAPAMVELGRAEELLHVSLLRAPASALTWTRLAYVLLARDAPRDLILRAFEASLLMAPNDRSLANARLTIAREVWSGLAAGSRHHVARAVRLLWGDSNTRPLLRPMWNDVIGQDIIRSSFDGAADELAKLLDYFGAL